MPPRGRGDLCRDRIPGLVPRRHPTVEQGRPVPQPDVLKGEDHPRGGRVPLGIGDHHDPRAVRDAPALERLPELRLGRHLQRQRALGHVPAHRRREIAELDEAGTGNVLLRVSPVGTDDQNHQIRLVEVRVHVAGVDEQSRTGGELGGHGRCGDQKGKTDSQQGRSHHRPPAVGIPPRRAAAPYNLVDGEDRGVVEPWRSRAEVVQALQGTKRYPVLKTVTIWRGRAGSASSRRRSSAMWESTVRESTSAWYPHTSRRRTARWAAAPSRRINASNSANALGDKGTTVPPRVTVWDAGSTSTSPKAIGARESVLPAVALRRSSAWTRSSSSRRPKGLVTY